MKNKKTLSVEQINKMFKDSDCDVRVAAMNACVGKDIPLNIIELWLKDSDCDVRVAAMNAFKKSTHPIPLIRTIEPPKLVCKKCIGNIIVVAEIPKDAQVRGRLNEKCRANKARIIEIIGDICGEKIGISIYDSSFFYEVGDIIEIDDFDCSDEECSTGFHFFCNKNLAENYNN